MKLRFIAKAKGRDWKVGETAEFNEKDGAEMSYARKYINRGWAEEVTPGGASAAKGGDKGDKGDKGADSK